MTIINLMSSLLNLTTNMANNKLEDMENNFQPGYTPIYEDGTGATVEEDGTVIIRGPMDEESATTEAAEIAINKQKDNDPYRFDEPDIKIIKGPNGELAIEGSPAGDILEEELDKW